MSWRVTDEQFIFLNINLNDLFMSEIAMIFGSVRFASLTLRCSFILVKSPFSGVAAGVERVGPVVLKEVKVGDTSNLQKQVFSKVNNTSDRATEQINHNGDIHQQTSSQPCPTCPRGGHRSGESCRGLEARGCFTCGLPGHFKGAPVCPGDLRL